MLHTYCLLFILLVISDVVLWRNFCSQQSAVLLRSVLLWLPTVVTMVCMIFLILQVRITWLMQFTFILFICIALPKLVFTFIFLIGKLVACQRPELLKYFLWIAGFFSFLTFSVQAYGVGWGWKRIVVSRQNLKLPQLPVSFRGYKIVQISDLHLGTYAGETGFISRLVDSIYACRPDMIVFTGDLVNTSSDEIFPYVRVLGRLKAPDGVYSVLGNHDYCYFQSGYTPKEQLLQTQRVIRAQRMMGWKVLLNEHQVIHRNLDSLYLLGVENTGKPPFPSRGDLQKAMTGVPNGGCKILLSHDPWHWRNGVVGKAPVQLTLSGHTHALQMQIGSFSPAQWFMPEWGGLYEKGGQKLFVSTGIGGSIPYRLGAWPKIELITLK